MAAVRSNMSGHLAHPNGYPVRVHRGDKRAEDDVLVQAHPWAFESDVEQATAAPSEKRARSRKTKPTG